MKTLIFLLFLVFLLDGSLQGQKDTFKFIDSPIPRGDIFIVIPDLPNKNNKITKHTLSEFKDNLAISMTNTEVVKKFEEPAQVTGSGINIYIYELVDSTELWIGFSGKKIIYAKHMDANHKLIETLNLKPTP